VHIQPSLTAILVLLVALSIDVTRARALGPSRENIPATPWRPTRCIFLRMSGAPSVVIAGIGLCGPVKRGTCLAELRRAVGGPDGRGRHFVGRRELSRRTLDALLDAARKDCSRKSPRPWRAWGVADVDRVRVRRAGNRILSTDGERGRTASLEQVHALSDAIETHWRDRSRGCMVHAEPRAPQGEHLFEAILRGGTKFGPRRSRLTAVQQAGN